MDDVLNTQTGGDEEDDDSPIFGPAERDGGNNVEMPDTGNDDEEFLEEHAMAPEDINRTAPPNKWEDADSIHNAGNKTKFKSIKLR